jgi:hypothetical protein
MFIISCKGKSSTNIEDFPFIHKIVDYDSIYSDKNDAPLGEVANIEIIDNIIITQNINDDHFFTFIDVDKRKLLTKWGARGQGPNEYVMIFGFTVSDDRIVFLDHAKQIINYVPLLSILKKDSVAKIIKESYPNTDDFRARNLTLIEDMKIITGSFNEGHFGILDKENKIINHSFDIPFTYSRIN